MAAAAELAIQWFWADLETGAQLAEYWYNSPETALFAICVLLLCRWVGVRLGERGSRIVAVLSAGSLGVYLLHYPALSVIAKLAVLFESIVAFLVVPLLFAVCEVVSLAALRAPGIRRLFSV